MTVRDRVTAAVAAFRAGEAGGGRDLRETMYVRNESRDFTNLKDPALADYLAGGARSDSGVMVSDRTVLSVATAWRCATLICGVIGSLPTDVMVRESETVRVPAVDSPFRKVLTERPNNRQTPAQFLKMQQLHKLQRGDSFAMKIARFGEVEALWPLDPTRMDVIENDDWTLTYRYTRRNGTTVDFSAGEILHNMGPTWDGVRGLPIIRFMAEAIGLNVQVRKAAAKLYRNGQFTSGFLKTEKGMSDQAYNRMIEWRDRKIGVDADDAMKIDILEEGLEYQAQSLSATDAQMVETLGLTKDDIGAFYGVPPHLYGDTEKSTSWGTGIEQQNIAFLQYTIEPHLTDWKQVLKRDCLTGPGIDPRLYVHFDLKGFLRADAATRSAYLSRALGAGGQAPWMTQNEARAYEDMPPRPEPWADELPKTGSGKPVETGNNGNAKSAGN
jgi:HK97 family phage portal protein